MFAKNKKNKYGKELCLKINNHFFLSNITHIFWKKNQNKELFIYFILLNYNVHFNCEFFNERKQFSSFILGVFFYVVSKPQKIIRKLTWSSLLLVGKENATDILIALIIIKNISKKYEIIQFDVTIDFRRCF